MIRGIFIPLLALILFIFSKKLRKRYFFEDRNLTDKAKSFNRNAHIAFEVSSEGEFEQVKPLLDLYLKRGLLIELIYSSDSLEEKIQKLTAEHSNLRSLRLPILSYGIIQNDLLGFQNISSWLTAKQLILCRYDFYPELLLYGLRKDVRFSLVSATFRNKSFSWWNKSVFNLFDFILTASKEDKKKILGLGVSEDKISTYEFRIPQIIERIQSKETKLEKFKELLDLINAFSKHKRIIMGSAWSNEVEVFSDEEFRSHIKNKSHLVLLLPHEFDDKIRKAFNLYPQLPIHVYKDGENLKDFIEAYNSSPGVLIFEVKGILLELYSYFGHAFVGGGHGRSVHSLLEPFLSGCHIYCGPKVHRSTEYDFIQNEGPKDLNIVENLESFYSIYKNVEEKELSSLRLELGNSFAASFNKEVDNLNGGTLN